MFSQLVWKRTIQIASAYSTTPSGKVFFVTLFHPGGNIIGAFKDNVLPAKDSTPTLTESSSKESVTDDVYKILEALLSENRQ